jgi:hypothetical protein
MGKAGKERKKRKLDAANALKDIHPVSGADELDQEEILAAAAVLTRVAKHPHLFHCKQAKPLRMALHTLISSGVLQGQRTTASTTAPSSSSVLGAGMGGPRQSGGSGSGFDLPSVHQRISTALKGGDWEVAKALIDGLTVDDNGQPRHYTFKLGTLQRWVRECDGVFGDDCSSSSSSDGGDRSEMGGVLACLDAMLRAVSPGQVPAYVHT